MVERLKEQKEAASIAHHESLKYAYGDLDADISELESWSKRKTTIRSESNMLSAFFGKFWSHTSLDISLASHSQLDWKDK